MSPKKLSAAQEAVVRAELSASRTPTVYRRAAALMAIHQGWSVGAVADLLGVARQSIYNWIAAYGTKPEGVDLNDAPRPGRPVSWTEELDAFLEGAFNCSPRSFGYSADHWTAGMLKNHVAFSLRKSFSDETLRRRLRQLGYVWKGGRYQRVNNWNNSDPAAATMAELTQDRDARQSAAV
jgi:transposase